MVDAGEADTGGRAPDDAATQMAVPVRSADVTPGWLERTLRSANVLGASARVTNVRLRDIGKGRGITHTTSAVEAEYDPPGAGPAQLCLKMPNLGFVEVLRHGNLSLEGRNNQYFCEVSFYRECAHLCPTRVCRFVWGHARRPEDAANPAARGLQGCGGAANPAALGSYGLLIEYLDDSKTYTTKDGLPLAKLTDAVLCAAKMAAWSFNDDERFLPVNDGGTCTWVNAASTYHKHRLTYEQGDWSFQQYADVVFPAEMPGETRVARALAAVMPHADRWIQARRHGHRCLANLDLRTENLVWQRVEASEASEASGPQYECVMLDMENMHYLAPGRELAMLLATSMMEGDMECHMLPLVEAYYTAMVAQPRVASELKGDGGAYAYTVDELVFDVRVGMWTVLCFVIGGVTSAMSAYKKHEGERGAGSASLCAMFRVLCRRCVRAIHVLDAFAVVDWMAATPALGADSTDPVDPATSPGHVRRATVPIMTTTVTEADASGAIKTTTTTVAGGCGYGV